MIVSRHYLSVLITFALVSGCSPPQTKSDDAQQAVKHAWVNDPALKTKLSVRVQPPGAHPEFYVYVPADYQMNVHYGAGGQTFMFRDKPRKDQTGLAFMIGTAEPTPYQKKPLTMQEGMEAFLSSIASGRLKFKSDPIEQGSINGQDFRRASWSAVEPNSKRTMHGFSYTTTIGTTLLMMSGQDFDPFSDETLKLAEEVARSYTVVLQSPEASKSELQRQ